MGNYNPKFGQRLRQRGKDSQNNGGFLVVDGIAIGPRASGVGLKCQKIVVP